MFNTQRYKQQLYLNEQLDKLNRFILDFLTTKLHFPETNLTDAITSWPDSDNIKHQGEKDKPR